MGIGEVLAFLNRVAEAELRTRCAKESEPDDRKYAQLVRELETLGHVLSAGMSRPAWADLPKKYKDWLKTQAGVGKQPRSVFAIAHYQHRPDLYRAWMGANELGPRGEAMEENLYITDTKGRLEVVARYYRCRTCFGNAKLEGGSRCPDCAGSGWEYGQGTKFKRLGKPLEVHKLGAPSDKLSKPAYDAIEALTAPRARTKPKAPKPKPKPKPRRRRR